MTSNRLPNGQQIGLLELQVLGVIGRHWAWSRACSSAAIRAVVWSAGIGSDVADCGACKNEGGQAVSAEQVRRATLRAG